MGVLQRELVASESRHRKRDALLVENLVKPIVCRVGGSVGGGTLEGALLSLKQMRRGEVSFNINEMVSLGFSLFSFSLFPLEGRRGRVRRRRRKTLPSF